MLSAAKLFKKRLEDALSPRGAAAEFCRKTGIARSTLQNWQHGMPPTLESMDRIAEGLGTTPWELIKPEGAQDAPSSPLIRGIIAALPALQENQLSSILNIVKAFAESNSGVEVPEKLARKKN